MQTTEHPVRLDTGVLNNKEYTIKTNDFIKYQTEVSLKPKLTSKIPHLQVRNQSDLRARL